VGLQAKCLLAMWLFFGVGAYVSTVMQMRFGFSPWWGLPGAALAGALVAGFVAVVSFRAGLKGSYFALITLAFGEVLRIISNSVDITGGGLMNKKKSYKK